MSGFIEWCIIASTILGFINFAFLVIVDNKFCEIKGEISRLKKEKGSDNNARKID